MTYKLRITTIILAVIALAGLTSCVYENEGDCGTYVRFVYDYNMQGSDGFSNEADRVTLYVFDAAGNLVTSLNSNSLGEDNTMLVPGLEQGHYKLVAWAKSDKVSDSSSDLDISSPSKGGSITELQAKVKTVADVSAHSLNSHLNGVLDAEITGRGQTLTINMIKCTNDLRVVLMPVRASQVMTTDKYELSVSANNGWLSHDASIYQEMPLEYHPYYYALSSASTKADEVISSALVADFATSRLFEDGDSRLVIKNTTTGSEILNISLEWMLTLQAISEHRSEWSDQEYLDRQDEYSITFFVDDSTWMENRIIVNGWVLSLEDAILN